MKFGSTQAIQADRHVKLVWSFLGDVLRDGRYALRTLWKSPAFTLVAVGSLALSIGTNVVLLAVLDAVLLRPLAVRDPASLYQVRPQAWAQGRLLTASYPAWQDFQRRNTAFLGIAGYNGYSSARLAWQRSTRNVAGVETTGNYFDLLGVQPQAGRLYHETDEHGPNSAPCVVLSDKLWRGEFGADPGVVGTVVQLDKASFTVIGVAAAAFHGTEQLVWPDYWIPMVNEAAVEGRDYLSSRETVAVTMIGRLKPGVSVQQATEDLNAIARQLGQEYPLTERGLPLRLIRPGLYGDNGDLVRGFLYGAGALAGLVLLAACANLAGLFAARAEDRRREWAIRAALGAGRGRLVRQLLTEALVVSLLGGAAGLWMAGVLLGMLNHWQSSYGHLDIGMDGRACLSALLLSLLSAVLFGTASARQVWRHHSAQAMKGGPADPAAPARRVTPRDLLLGAQITACTLLVAASLVAARGLSSLLHLPLGFRPQGALLAEVDVGPDAPSGEQAFVQAQADLAAVRNLPGVAAAGATSRVPLTGGLRATPVFPPGTTDFALTNAVLSPYVFTVSPGYLAAAGTRLVEGRDVSGYDTALTPAVAVVNATFARKLWGQTSALGQRFLVGGRLTEVVGVAEDGRYHDIVEESQPAAYLPWSQNEGGDAIFVVRPQEVMAPPQLAAALERVLAARTPGTTVAVRTWSDALGFALFPARAAAVALGTMGILAAVLALSGIFGTAAYNVSRRKKELGIRAALGASGRRVLGAAVGRTLVLLGVGTATGLLLSIATGRFLRQVVQGGDPQDPAIVGSVVLIMTLLGSAACLVPALRALAINPARLLREE